MAFLKGIDGTLYEVPDKDLENFKVPAEKVKDVLKDMSEVLQEQPAPSGKLAGAPAPSVHTIPGHPQVVVQIFTNNSPQEPSGNLPPPNGAEEAGDGDVSAQNYCSWRNNPWRNSGWRNCY